MAFKNTLIKSITAVLCVIALSVTACISTGKYCDARIEAAKLSGTAAQTGGDAVNPDGTPADPAADATDPSADATDPAADATQADGTPAADGTTAAPAANGTTAKPGATSSAPTTPAQIISVYNTATAKVVSAKAGYAKTRLTDNEKLDAPAVLKTFKSLIYKFMGIGTDNKYSENVEKGKWGDNPYILAGKLATGDVSSAKCTSANGVYTITMTLKNGSSSANKSKPTTAPNSALDKSGICVGTEDKSRFDHKTASVIYDAIAGTYAGVEIAESYSNATIKATVDAKTGNLTSLKVDWNCSVKISKILGATASATGISHVAYSNFKY